MLLLMDEGLVSVVLVIGVKGAIEHDSMLLDELMNTAMRRIEQANNETDSHVRRVTGSRLVSQVWLTRDVCESA